MRITVRHKKCGTIYYVTPKQFKDSDDFVPVEEGWEPEKPVSALDMSEPDPADFDLSLSEDEEKEILQETLKERGIKFHPNAGLETLRKKLEEG